MKDFDKIYIAWRKGLSSRRYIVGVLEYSNQGKYSFRYFREKALEAKKDGFAEYTEFPELDTVYTDNVLEIFSQRLIKAERPDIKNFYKFWEVELDRVDDKFYLLGHTQGFLPTDNYEFLADYNLVPDLHFLTDLAGLSIEKHSPDTLSIGDDLSFVIESDNEYDKEAVAVYKLDKKIGYIKKIHCKVFHKPGSEKLKLTVKAIDKNGVLKRAFITVSMPESHVD